MEQHDPFQPGKSWILWLLSSLTHQGCKQMKYIKLTV